ncbi:MAG: hypothetical protein R3F36_06290 [Candidatus Competibacteraceae bacterium]
MHQDRLTVFQALGDQRERAVTLGDIARIKGFQGRGGRGAEAASRRANGLPSPGDQRSRAVTLGDIARIKVSKGEVDEALKLHQEMLTVFQALGDVVGNAHVLWSIAQIEMQKKEITRVLFRRAGNWTRRCGFARRKNCRSTSGSSRCGIY